MGSHKFWYALLSCIHVAVSSRTFCHEPSMVVVKPEKNNTESDFGFSIALQDGQYRKLVVGAPNRDREGKVFLCDLADVLKSNTASCNPVDINITSLIGSKIVVNNNQKYKLGISVAGGTNYFVTCAPEIPLKLTVQGKEKKAFGACFLFDGSAHVIQGSLEKYIEVSPPDDSEIIGGMGTNILIDESKDSMMIVKSTYAGDIQYSKSMNASASVNFIKNSMEDNIKMQFKKNSNIGYGIAKVNSFETDTIYAFTAKSDDLKGQVMFMEPNRQNPDEMVVKDRIIKDTSVGSMFGYTLAKGYVSKSGEAGVIVGAPGYFVDRHTADLGAVHIYLDNDKKLTIHGVKDQARFGSTLLVQDLDGDEIPELIVGAPYEEQGLGAVYIISGIEVKTKLQDTKNVNQVIPVSSFTQIQRIHSTQFKRLGFSIHSLLDIDDNGAKDIAIGSPDSASVLLLRSIPVEKFEITFFSVDNVRKEQDMTADVILCIKITNRIQRIARRLSVTTNITGEAMIENPIFSIVLPADSSEQRAKVTIKMKNKESGVYNFSASIDIEPEMKEAMKSNVFDKTWFLLDKKSQEPTTKTIYRKCTGDDCSPKLNISLLWNGPKNFTVGTQETVNLLVNITNDGHVVDASCIKMNVIGAQLNSAFERNDTVYTIPLPPFKRESKSEFNLTLDMSKIVDTDKQLSVSATLRAKCSEESTFDRKDELHVDYLIDSDDIIIAPQIIKSLVLNNADFTNEGTIIDRHEYTITNSGGVRWVNISSDVFIDKQSYITGYNVSMTDMGPCVEVKHESKIKFTCKIELNRYDRKQLFIDMKIEKQQLQEEQDKDKLMTSSHMDLVLESIHKVKTASVSKTLKYFVVNKSKKPLLILVSIIVAALVMAITTFGLYKYGFFERKEKTKTENLKKTIRRKSLHTAGNSNTICVVDDELQNRCGSTLLSNDQLEIVASVENLNQPGQSTK